MFRSSFAASALASLVLLAALPGCGAADDASPEASLIIRGSAVAPAAAGYDRQGVPPGSLVGDPASIVLELHALLLGSRPDCADLSVVVDHGTTPEIVDLGQHPVLFAESPPDGSYGCVAFRMSDQITVRPASTFGGCSAETAYLSDIYRQGQFGYRDEHGAYASGQGTDEQPQADEITLVMTGDRAAAEAQGFSAHQIVDLGAPLTVPGSSTFYWNGEGTVASVKDRCEVYPGKPTFF